jgi:hypothetical protein
VVRRRALESDGGCVNCDEALRAEGRPEVALPRPVGQRHTEPGHGALDQAVPRTCSAGVARSLLPGSAGVLLCPRRQPRCAQNCGAAVAKTGEGPAVRTASRETAWIFESAHMFLLSELWPAYGLNRRTAPSLAKVASRLRCGWCATPRGSPVTAASRTAVGAAVAPPNAPYTSTALSSVRR